MPSFNFRTRFAESVKLGTKRQTIRATRKHRPRVGQVAHCFVGLRTQKCRPLGQWRIVEVVAVQISTRGVSVNGKTVPPKKLDRFAQADGFSNWREMRTWFEDVHGLPFAGDLVRWEVK